MKAERVSKHSQGTYQYPSRDKTLVETYAPSGSGSFDWYRERTARAIDPSHLLNHSPSRSPKSFFGPVAVYMTREDDERVRAIELKSYPDDEPLPSRGDCHGEGGLMGVPSSKGTYGGRPESPRDPPSSSSSMGTHRFSG